MRARKKVAEPPETSATDEGSKLKEGKQQLIEELKSLRACCSTARKDEQVFKR